MKKLVAFLLAVVMALSLCACQKEEMVTVSRSFIAGYGSTSEDGSIISGGRVLVNLLSNGSADFYIGTLEDGIHSMEHYSGTYTLGENEEFDETISISYNYGENQSAETKDAVIIDGIFEMPFHFMGEISEKPISFYETSPASMDGDVYVGYMTKVGGMGPMVYAYSLCLKEDNKFDVSIMQMASVMHVWGKTDGSYSMDGENITFTYDICTTEGEVVSADEVVVGSGYSKTSLMTAFNIQQANMKATMAPFIRVK